MKLVDKEGKFKNTFKVLLRLISDWISLLCLFAFEQMTAPYLELLI